MDCLLVPNATDGIDQLKERRVVVLAIWSNMILKEIFDELTNNDSNSEYAPCVYILIAGINR